MHVLYGFDRIKRTESPQAANLRNKIIDVRSPQRSTALVTNIDFDAWGGYLGDAPLAMAILDQVVNGATICCSRTNARTTRTLTRGVFRTMAATIAPCSVNANALSAF